VPVLLCARYISQFGTRTEPQQLVPQQLGHRDETEPKTECVPPWVVNKVRRRADVMEVKPDQRWVVGAISANAAARPLPPLASTRAREQSGEVSPPGGGPPI
jgi:hypothetical protein